MKHINIGSQPNDNTGDSVRESFNKTNQNFQEIHDMILDEDDFASDSESSLATQQSIKAYVDAEVATAGKVDSVNGEQGEVVLDSGKITEGSNLYYTEDRVSNNTNVVANTAKISADGSVTEHNDVTDAGSGKIITYVERLTINDNSQAINNLALNNHPKATLSADSDPALTLSGQEFKLTLPELLNEDDLSSDSEIQGATQQSIKTYVDNHSLRGVPVDTVADLQALNARDYEIRRVGTTTEYKFVLGKTPEGTDVVDDAGTGAWELLPNLQTMESDVLLGQTFFSTSKRIRPGLCYAGETYNWSDNSKLKSLFEAEGHDFITDNGDNTFTVVDHTDFIRAGVSNIGTHVDDTTAVNGLSDTGHTHQQRSGDGGGSADGTTAQGTGVNNQTGFNTALGFANLTGDSETAPNHRTAYFGIYGDLAVAVVNADLVPVEDVENIIYEVANYNGPGLKISTSGHSEISLGFDITACDYIDFTFGDTDRANIQDQYIWHDSLDVSTLQASQKWIARRHDNNYIWFRTNGGQDLTLGELDARGYNISSNTHLLKAVGYAKKTLKSIINPSANILDEDDMVSNSRTDVPSQQSVKTYVDNRPTLRGLPVSDLASLTSIDAKDFEIRRVNGVGTFEFKLGGTPDANNPADDAGTGAWFRTVAQDSINTLNYHDTISYYFDNVWDNTKADFGDLEGFVKDTNTHYLAERNMLVDLTATIEASEGPGLTLGLRWQIYTGSFWQDIGTSTSTVNNQGGQNRFTDHARVRINQGEYIRLLGYTANNGSNTYPGNRNIRVSIVEINQSQFQTSLNNQEPELVNQYLPANLNRNTETRITVLQAVLPTPGIWSINTKMTVFDVQDVVPGFELLVEDNSVILEDAIEVGENNAIYNRFSKSGSITVKTTTNNAIVKLDGLWTNNSDTQYVESDNSYTYINAVQLYKN